MLRFTTTRMSGLRAAGRLAEMQHAVIAPLLGRELGLRHERLFADFEPEGSDGRAWYADVAGRPRRVADLAPGEAEAIRATTSAMIDEIRAVARRMSSDTPQKANLARLLDAATTFPAEDLWCDGDQPLIVNWGFEREDDRGSAAPQAITALADARTLDRAGSSGPWSAFTRHRVGPSALSGTSLLWLLFILLIIGIDRTLLPACGVAGRWSFLTDWSVLDACKRPAGVAEAAEGARLQSLVRDAELRVASRDRICTAPVSVTDPGLPFDREVERRLPASAPRGNVEIALLWDNRADLDLIVECPAGDRLWQASPGLQACGGRLMEDINKNGRPLTDHPIEQAAWDRPAPGLYGIKVMLFGYNGVPEGTDVPFTIRVRQGSDEKLFHGHVAGVRATVTGATVTF